MKRGLLGMGLAGALCALACPQAQAMNEIGRFENFSGAGGFTSAAVDAAGGFAYFGSSVAFFDPVSNSSFSVLTQFSLSAPSAGGNFFRVPGLADPGAMVTDSAGFLYLASSAAPAAVGKVPSNFMSFSSATLAAGQNAIGSGVIDSAHGFAYFGTLTQPGQVIKIRLSDLVEVSSITLSSGADNLASAVIDTVGGFAYFGSSDTPGLVTRVQLSNFTETGRVTFKAGEGPALSAVIDIRNGFAYFGTGDSPGKVIQIGLTNFKETAALALNTGLNQLTSAVIDPQKSYAYFGTNTSPGKIVQVGLAGGSPFQNGVLSLAAGEDFLRSAVIDTVNEYAYFGTLSYPAGVIAQIDLIPSIPQITVQPEDQTVSEGQSANFSLTAVGRSLAYQWLRNGAVITGADAANYTLPNVSLADSGSVFSCTVSNSAGSVTSQSALLSVRPAVRVFPNPWRADRPDGSVITFDNLAPGSTVKIFTLSAHWVKTIPAAGASTTWDLTNDAGEKVASGYYFYWVSVPNDAQDVQGKLAIIR